MNWYKVLFFALIIGFILSRMVSRRTDGNRADAHGYVNFYNTWVTLEYAGRVDSTVWKDGGRNIFSDGNKYYVDLVSDSIWYNLEPGDSVVKRKGEIYLEVFRNDSFK